MNEITPTPPAPAEAEPPVEIPEGIRRARAHLRADLPGLLASWWTRGKWALYSKDGRVKIGRDFRKLDQEALRRGLDVVDYIIERIEPGAGSDEEIEDWEPIFPETTPPTPPTEMEPPLEIPEGIRRARAHLRADLPALLASWWTRGKWACYSKDGRVKIGRDYLKLIGEVIRRGIPDGEYIIERIDARAGSEEEEDISR